MGQVDVFPPLDNARPIIGGRPSQRDPHIAQRDAVAIKVRSAQKAHAVVARPTIGHMEVVEDIDSAGGELLVAGIGDREGNVLSVWSNAPVSIGICRAIRVLIKSDALVPNRLTVPLEVGYSSGRNRL